MCTSVSTHLQKSLTHRIRPEARERFIQEMDWSEFPDLRVLNNRSVSVNWPHGQSKIFNAVSQKEVRLNPDFEAHIRKLENWSVGKEVVERFPFLKGIRAKVNAEFRNEHLTADTAA
jgi:hypothetical protein